jgi:hypothetical protein
MVFDKGSPSAFLCFYDDLSQVRCIDIPRTQNFYSLNAPRAPKSMPVKLLITSCACSEEREPGAMALPSEAF